MLVCMEFASARDSQAPIASAEAEPLKPRGNEEMYERTICYIRAG